MHASASTTSAPQPLAGLAATIHVTPAGVNGLKQFEQEIATYRRELPRLLEQGEAGRYVLIKGDELLNIWDTQGDAIQVGRERFGLEPIFVKLIDARDPERFALLDAWKEAQCQH